MHNSAEQCGLIFDVDGVLIDSAAAHFESWQRLAQEQGVAISESRFAQTFGRHNRDIIPMLFHPDDDETIAHLSNRKEAIYRDIVRAQPPVVSGAAELLRDAQRCGFRLAVGSSAPRENIDLVLNALDADGAFEVIVAAENVQRGKPDPQVFQLAVRGLGIEPAQCVVIEDAPVGIAAAKAAGCMAVGIAIYHAADELSAADWVVHSLNQVSTNSLQRLVKT